MIRSELRITPHYSGNSQPDGGLSDCVRQRTDARCAPRASCRQECRRDPYHPGRLSCESLILLLAQCSLFDAITGEEHMLRSMNGLKGYAMRATDGIVE